MKKVWKWIIGIVVVLVVVAAVVGVVLLLRAHVFANTNWCDLGWCAHPSRTLPAGRGDWGSRMPMRSMGRLPYGGLFGGLLLMGLLVLTILGIVWLARKLTEHPTPPAPLPTCAHCGQPVQSNWVACPHCGNKL